MTSREEEGPCEPLPPLKRPRLQTMVTLGDRSPAVAALKPAHSTGGGGGAAPVAAAVDGEPLGRSGLLDRTQYIRLLEQALSSLGYTDVASQLERASGITAQPPQASRGRRAAAGCSGLPCPFMVAQQSRLLLHLPCLHAASYPPSSLDGLPSCLAAPSAHLLTAPSCPPACPLEQVTQLQAAVLAGDWAAAAKHLSRLDLRSQHALQVRINKDEMRGA